MCNIIIANNLSKIDKSIIEKNYKINSDGFGVIYKKGKKVCFSKGVMGLKDVIKIIEKLKKNNKSAVLHFRAATSGSVNRALSHPFLVTKDLERFFKVNASGFGELKKGEFLLVHNGVLTSYKELLLQVLLENCHSLNIPLSFRKLESWSDTFVLSFMFSVYQYDLEQIKTALSEYALSSFSKFVLVDHNFKVYEFGKFYEDKETDIKFSSWTGRSLDEYGKNWYKNYLDNYNKWYKDYYQLY